MLIILITLSSVKVFSAVTVCNAVVMCW